MAVFQRTARPAEPLWASVSSSAWWGTVYWGTALGAAEMLGKVHPSQSPRQDGGCPSLLFAAHPLLPATPPPTARPDPGGGERAGGGSEENKPESPMAKRARSFRLHCARGRFHR